MKEKIYTIPVNEAFDSECSCPVCLLEKKLEREAVEYALGAAMMEPDYRIESNEKGYCRRHFSQMLKCPNKLSLSLVLETHLDEVIKKLGETKKAVEALDGRGVFKKNTLTGTTEKISKILDDTEHRCIVCDKINHTISRYCGVILYMWDKDEAFRKKFSERSLCLRHSRMLFDIADKELSDTKAREFVKQLFKKQQEELIRRRELIHKFTLKFDYRYRDMELGEARTAVTDAVEYLSGYTDYSEEK